MKITRYIKSYGFPKPPRLTQDQFVAIKQGAPMQPYINIWNEFLKENAGSLAFRTIFFWVPTGSLTSAYNHLKMLNKKKKFFTALNDAINLSDTFHQYSEKYDKLINEYFNTTY